MFESLTQFFSSRGFMPHGHCYLWKPALVWIHASSDFLIGLAYVSISITLIVLIRKIRLPFSTMVLSFGLFIGACGLTHFMEVWTLWWPDYWWSGGVKIVTALASLSTGLWLIRLRHSIVTVAETARISEQRRLNLEVLARDLESRVHERTHALEEANLALQESEARFRITFEQAPVGIAHVDLDGRWLRANRKYAEMLGYSSDELKTTSFQAVTHPEELRIDEEFVRKLLDGAMESYQLEKRYIRKDGQVIWVLLSVSLVRRPDGSPAYFVASALDITDRKRSEEELRKISEGRQAALLARDEFISVASHELKTPITSMKMQFQMTDRVRKRSADGAIEGEWAEKLMSTLSRQVEKLTRLVDDMLDVARINTGKLTMQFEEMDASAVIGDGAARFKEQCRREGVEFSYRVEPGIVAHWDPIRIEQIGLNLLTNALKYGERKPIELVFRRVGADQAEVQVKDYGMGIPAESQRRIFERFERATPSSGISGLGLGLYIVRQIVQAHRGKIRVESEPGRGSLFVVTLPLDAGAASVSGAN